MASGGTRAAAAAALLFCFCFSAVVLLLVLQAPRRPGLAAADLLTSALDRFLDGRGLLELATRRNMILLCHAILLLILRDAGVLGAPARRRSRSPPAGEAVVVAQIAAPSGPHATRTAVVVAQTVCSAVVPVPARHHATRTAVVWRRRPRNRTRAAAAPMHEHHDAAAAARSQVECHPASEAAAATWAAPVRTTVPPAQADEASAAVATKQIVVVEPPRNDEDDDNLLDRRDRAAVVEPVEHPTAIAAYGESYGCDDRRITTVPTGDDDTARLQQTAGMEAESEIELADDRTFEEFIKSQRRKMRQESLQLVRSSGYHYQAIAACY